MPKREPSSEYRQIQRYKNIRTCFEYAADQADNEAIFFKAEKIIVKPGEPDISLESFEVGFSYTQYCNEMTDAQWQIIEIKDQMLGAVWHSMILTLCCILGRFPKEEDIPKEVLAYYVYDRQLVWSNELICTREKEKDMILSWPVPR